MMVQGLRAALDGRKNGTHYADRMTRILGVCQDCGILWHDERVTFRNGATEMRRIDDIEPVGNVIVAPQHEKYGLRVSPRVLPKLKSMAPQFAYALNVAIVTVQVDGNVVYVRVPRPAGDGSDLVTFAQAWKIQPDLQPGYLLLGVDDDHQQLVVEMTSPANVHAAVIGMTGSGKSTLMRTMILSALMAGGSQVALFDPSGGFFPLSGHPAIWRGGMFRYPEDCERGLELLANTIGRKHYGLLYLFIDEVPELVAQRRAIKQHIARLAQAGRHSGIHLILGAQHPLASELGSTTMRNIALRLIGRVADRSAAYNASGRNDSGADNLVGKGDFVVVNGSTLRHFQAAFPTEALLAKWAQRYPPREPRMPAQADGALAFRPTATASDRESGGGDGGGRPLDEIPDVVLREIRRYVRRHGREPSSNWVYRMTRGLVPTGGFNRDKAQRAIQMATQDSGTAV
jgi:DNA segregation ATPase FtsK/SpoIIIE-like protein